MADDYPNSTDTTGLVAINAPGSYPPVLRTQGDFEVAGDIDLFKIDLVAGRTYIISMSTTRAGVDPLLLLFYPANTLVGGNDDAYAGNLNSQFVYTATETGTYYLQANSFTEATGRYTLTAWEVGADLYAGDTTTTGTLGIGNSARVTSLFENPGDIDALAIELTAGAVYRFDLIATDGTIDPSLTLRDAANTLLSFNDDWAMGMNDAQIIFAPQTSGTYYLLAEEYNGNMGAYNIRATALNVTNGTGFSDVLTGTNGDDALLGRGGRDSLFGGIGNDYLDGGARDDLMVGGAGNDTYIVNDANDMVVEYLRQGTDTVLTALGSYELPDNVENLFYTGSGNFTGLGNTRANVLQGGAGNDWLDGRGGADGLYGGAGNDTYVIDNRNDYASEAFGAGRDTILSSISWDLGDNIENLTLTGDGDIDGRGNAQNNVLVGNGGSNILLGGAGRDFLAGMEGLDRLNGGEGADIYMVYAASEHTGAEFADKGTLLTDRDEVRFATTADDTLVIFAEDTGIERVIIGTGTRSNAVTSGTNAAGIDASASTQGLILVGNAGNNTITGSMFDDKIRGGLGSDTFRFVTALDSATNVDTIINYDTSEDVIHLDSAIFTALTTTGALSSNNFATNATGTATDADDYILYDTTTGNLFYDADGNGAGAAVQFAIIQGLTGVMSADEFFVI